MKAGQEGGAPAKVKVEKAEKMEEDGNDDEEMAEVKTEVKNESITVFLVVWFYFLSQIVMDMLPLLKRTTFIFKILRKKV